MAQNTSAEDNMQRDLALQMQAKTWFRDQSFQELLSINPSSVSSPEIRAGVLQYIAAAAMQTGRYPKAQMSYQQALECCNEQQKPAIRTNLARVLSVLGRFDESENMFIELLQENSRTTGVLSGLAKLYADLDQYSKIEKLAEDYKTSPELFSLNARLAEWKAGTGDNVTAARFYRLAILDKENKNCQYSYPYFMIESVEENDPVIIKVKAALADASVDVWSKVHNLFALGSNYDRLGNYALAADCFIKANAIEKKMTGFRFEGLGRFFKAIPVHYNKVFASLKAVDSNIKPIFIVGLPRSGTTLLEHHIGMLDEVSTTGENAFVELCIFDEADMDDANVVDAAAKMLQFSGEQWQRLGEAYLQRIRKKCGDDVSVFTDKTLDNFRFAGYLKKLFPKAVFIDIKKERMNATLACYIRKFDGGFFYTSDMNDCLSYYDAYMELCSFWKKDIGESFVQLDYEVFIEEYDTKVKELINAIGLEWQKEVLDFANTGAVVSTISKSQLREGIHKQVKDRWALYQPYIAPLING